MIEVELWCAVTIFAVLGGIWYGGLALAVGTGRSPDGAARRAFLRHQLGRRWEWVHAWFALIVVILGTCFPHVAWALLRTFAVPLGVVVAGLLIHGASYAIGGRWGHATRAAPVATPFFLGAIAGGVATGRVTFGEHEADLWSSWLNPTSVLGGALAMLACTYLAAVVLGRAAEIEPAIEPQHTATLESAFRRTALISGVLAGIACLVGVQVLRDDAASFFEGVVGDAAPVLLIGALTAIASLILVAARSRLAAAATAIVAVGSGIIGWGIAQHPDMLVNLVTIDDAKASFADHSGPAFLLAAVILALCPTLLLPLDLVLRPVDDAADAGVDAGTTGSEPG